MTFAELLLERTPDPAWVLENQFAAQKALFEKSSYVRAPGFDTIQVRDLRLLFEFYDEAFFAGNIRVALGSRPLTFRFAPRMTRTAGTTSKTVDRRTGAISFQISIALSLLFEGFGASDHRDVTVCGVDCQTRLEALQRVLEHEMVHLIEYLCWGESNCSAQRFQTIAGRWFLHRAHTHALITRRERAAVTGIRPGARVAFVYEGRTLNGVVNRVTKRVTVLVEDAGGMRYSDGKRYAKYYIPISALELT